MRCWSFAVVLLAACGSDPSAQDSDASPDAPPPDAAADIDADVSALPRHTFIVSKLQLPSNASESVALGLDIDNKPNDGIDNQLGMLLASIRSLAPGLTPQ